MRYNQLLIPTVKEVPAEAEIISHQLMIRAGFIRKVASGTYTYLPLGKRMLDKVMAIVRQEMNAAGAQEILLPVIQPMELWQQTGRNVDYGETLGHFEDRHGRENVIAPTAEEVVTALAAGEISSYKQLPVNLYQINTKFRDEFRPRFGVLRSREFIMKDAYSFHADLPSLEETYRKMYDAYCRIFRRCGIPFVIVEAESGPIGGSASHEFMVPTGAGEDILFYTEDGAYAANVEKAEVDPLPLKEGARQARAAAPLMEEVHTPGVGSIEAVCNFLGTQPAAMIKTLIYTAPGIDKEGSKQIEQEKAKHDGRKVIVGEGSSYWIVAALVRGDHELNENKLAHALGVDHVALADENDVRDITGAAVGFAGPIRFAANPNWVIIDHAVAAMGVGVTGANKTDYHVKNVVPGRDFPLEGANVVVADIRNAVEGDTHGGRKLLSRHGIEVGHVFKLGTKYSVKLGASFLDEAGQQKPCIMGCYGIGINRIIASAIEEGHDDNGCILPITIAPFEVIITAINANSPAVKQAAEKLHDDLAGAGVEVLLDDRDARPGVKFKDADLLGIPIRVAVGEKGLAQGKIELKRRTDEKPVLIHLSAAVAETLKVIEELRARCRP